MGGLFIAVVLAFPRGLAGLVTDQIVPRIVPRLARLGASSSRHAEPSPAPAE